jgi:hypothetical protein
VTKQVDPQVRASLVERLRERQTAGDLHAAEVRQAAVGLGIAERTLWAWLADEQWSGRRKPRPRYEITEADRDAYAKWRGNIAAIHRERVTAGEVVPSLRRFQAAFARDMSPGERAAAVDGVEGRRRHEVYLRWAPDARNALWEADHKQLPVLVLASRAHRPRKPWVTLVELGVDLHDPQPGAVVDRGELVELPAPPDRLGYGLARGFRGGERLDELYVDLDLVAGALFLVALPTAVVALVALVSGQPAHVEAVQDAPDTGHADRHVVVAA